MNFVIVFKCCENPYCSRALYFANFATLASWQKQRVTNIYFSSNLLVEPVKTPKLRVLQYRIKNKKVLTKTFYICGDVSVRPWTTWLCVLCTWAVWRKRCSTWRRWYSETRSATFTRASCWTCARCMSSSHREQWPRNRPCSDWSHCTRATGSMSHVWSLVERQYLSLLDSL